MKLKILYMNPFCFSRYLIITAKMRFWRLPWKLEFLQNIKPKPDFIGTLPNIQKHTTNSYTNSATFLFLLFSGQTYQEKAVNSVKDREPILFWIYWIQIHKNFHHFQTYSIISRYILQTTTTYIRNHENANLTKAEM